MCGVIRILGNRVPNIDKAVISVHCHDDLGMAVANSLAAVRPAPGRSNARSTAWASGRATLAGRNRHGLAHAQRLSTTPY